MSDKKKDEPKAAPKKEDDKRTPDEWMARLQKYTVGPRMGKLGRRKLPLWQHSAADAICGWSQHKKDANEPFKLTEAAYLAALKASEAPPYRPPKEARSPYLKLNHGD